MRCLLAEFRQSRIHASNVLSIYCLPVPELGWWWLAGARQFHFPIYYDPHGTEYTENAGLKIANMSGNVSALDEKWTYPGQ